MATLSMQEVVQTGLEPVLTAAGAGGDEFLNTNSGLKFIQVVNGGGSACVVTVNSQTACDQGADHDLVVSVPAGEERWIGPLHKTRFNDSAGKVQITYDQVTTVTVGAFRTID